MLVFPSAFSLVYACREQGKRDQQSRVVIGYRTVTGLWHRWRDAGSHDVLCTEQVLKPL